MVWKINEEQRLFKNLLFNYVEIMVNSAIFFFFFFLSDKVIEFFSSFFIGVSLEVAFGGSSSVDCFWALGVILM